MKNSRSPNLKFYLSLQDEGKKLVRFLGGAGGEVIRNRHSIHIAMGVLRAHWGKGIGTLLLESISSWAEASYFHRLELTVIETNHRAKSLYEKAGFETEGIKRNSLRVNNNYINEYYMSKLIKA